MIATVLIVPVKNYERCDIVKYLGTVIGENIN